MATHSLSPFFREDERKEALGKVALVPAADDGSESINTVKVPPLKNHGLALALDFLAEVFLCTTGKVNFKVTYEAPLKDTVQEQPVFSSPDCW
ncbi:unnamed protein product [Clonostachys chloroleuca]|uniref:Uncharacterized protein n=1 Tax=Clonostachys chloroleuca TaxID=1926264 RepID=A0AA35QAL5_9HYPO|nr:unnamed protein product [Clonostachys chloroleuca]